MSDGDLILRRTLRAAGALCFESTAASLLLGRRRERLLDRALRSGLSPVLEAPLRYLSRGDLAAEDRRTVERIEAARAGLATRGDDQVRSPAGRRVPLRRVALAASVDRRFGTFLYLCAKAIGARTALELGSAVGVGTAYLAAATDGRVISIEGSSERATIARETVATVGADAEIVVGRFRQALPGILEQLDGGLDLAWIDGHHRRDATLRYFETIKPKLNAGAVVAFDDIRASAEMRDAWDSLRHADGFADTVDLDAIGIGVWAGSGAPRSHDLRGVFGPPRWAHAVADRLRD